MKKLIVVLLVALLAVALVACTTPADTTKADSTTAKPVVTTAPGTEDNNTPITTVGGDTVVTTVPPVTTETPVTTEPKPVVDGYDILWGDLEYAAINSSLHTSEYGVGPQVVLFENTHGDLDFHWSAVINMIECDMGIYETLIQTNAETGEYVVDSQYKWVFTIDGQDIEITRFSVFNGTTNGWVRMDLGANFSFDNYEFTSYEEYPGVLLHAFDMKLNIYGSDGKVLFYAYLTDPEWNGPHYMEKPASIDRIPDPNRPENVTLVGPTAITPISGPKAGQGEGYEKLFDGDYRSKICDGTNGEEGACIARFDSVKSLAGFSLCNANDNESYNGRTVVAFELYVSDDGETWELAYSDDGLNDDGTAIDKAPLSTNYAERYYSLGATSIDATYVKLVINNGEMYQIGDILFYEG